MSWSHSPTAAAAAAAIATPSDHLPYRVAPNTNSAAAPWIAPERSVSSPHCDPRIAETVAATSSVRSDAPGLRMMSPPRTAGMSQTPEMMYCAGVTATKMGFVASHTEFHAQKTTPNATASAAATTMSTVRHVRSLDISRPSPWCFKNEQRPRVERDPRGQRRDLVAESACASEAERFIAQCVAQTFRGDAAGIAVHRKERDEGADRPGEGERSLSADRTDPERASARFDADPVVYGIREEQKVRRLVVETVATQRAEEDDLGRACRDRLRDGELEIGLVLRRRKLRDRDPL